MKLKYDAILEELEKVIKGDVTALPEAFNWGLTPQGHYYWFLQLDEEEPLDIEALKEIRREVLEDMQSKGTEGSTKGKVRVTEDTKWGGTGYLTEGKIYEVEWDKDGVFFSLIEDDDGDALLEHFSSPDHGYVYEVVTEEDEESTQRASDNVKHPSQNTGGPATYYDLPFWEWQTLNDMLEHLAVKQWGAYSLHFKDMAKALVRFGVKTGTSKEYDIEKMIYSGCRAMVMLSGKDSLREYLKRLLDDPQFK